MLKKTIFVLIITAIFLSYACNKDPKIFTISGQVTDAYSSKQISGVRVYLDSRKIDGGVYSSTFSNIAFAETNSKGEYSFEIEQANTESYRFRVSKNSYYDIEEIVSVETIEAKDKFNKNFILTGESWINLKVKNTMPQSTDDEIDYRYVNITVVGLDCCDNEPNIGIGAEYTQDILCRAQSDDWIKLEWVVKKNGGQIYHTDSIYTTFGQTIIYNLNY